MKRFIMLFTFITSVFTPYFHAQTAQRMQVIDDKVILHDGGEVHYDAYGSGTLLAM